MDNADANMSRQEAEDVDDAVLQAEHDQWLNTQMFGKRVVPKRWLFKKIDPAEYGPIRIPCEDYDDLVIGEDEWAEIFSILQEGDEIWRYSYVPHPKMGEAGLALLRGGEVLVAWQLSRL